MNTSKQVNAMIGLLFVAFLVFSVYWVVEGQRAEAARANQDALLAQRGAELFVNNCRSCHGMTGRGPEEGGLAPALNTTAFLILDEDNPFDQPPTVAGEASSIEQFLFDTIACGRTNTAMPLWSEEHGGALSETQINYIVKMITQGRWDLVEHIGEEHDAELTPRPTWEGDPDADPAVPAIQVDPAALAVTTGNCGQYSGETAAEFRSRDPFSTAPAPAPAETPDDTSNGNGEPEPPADGDALAASMGEWFVEAPAQAEAGSVQFAVTNEGGLPHEFVIARTDLAQDELPESGGAVDEGAVEVLGRTEVFGAGEQRSLDASLEAGDYVLFCNVVGHYQLGMHTGFSVE